MNQYSRNSSRAEFINANRRLVLVSLFLFIFFIGNQLVFAQSIIVGSNIEDYYRRKQLTGNLDSTISFTVRPLSPAFSNNLRDNNLDSLLNFGKRIYNSKSNKSEIQILPVTWQQRYHGNPYYSRNDGAMIPSKGYQSLISAGVFAKVGPLSIQVKPEYVFAANDRFNEVPVHYGATDLPVRFGNGSYSQLSWGQSSIRLNFDPISIGLSNENLWWGPGMQNSLLMSNTAPGFKHLTLNTTSPIKTPIGSIEGQIVAGRLEGSGYNAALTDDWRYLSGFVMSYQPRWFPGLFLGLTRSFQTYSEDLGNSFDDYLPFLQAFQKVNTNEDSKKRDQLASIFMRWLLTKSKAEIYFECGKNDHAANIRDFLMSPEHSRAYTLGINKLIPYRGKKDEYIQVGLEINQLEQSIDRVLRQAGEWYTHTPIFHGYTNRGEVLGAGIGPSGNLQSFNISWVKGIKQIGLQLERYEHNGDLAYVFGYNPWIDFSVSAIGNWNYKRFIFNTKLQTMQSVNYQWLSGPLGSPNKNVFHINGEIGLMYRF